MKLRSISVFGQPTRLSSRMSIRSAVGPQNLQDVVKRLLQLLLMLFLITGLLSGSLRARAAGGTVFAAAEAQEGKGTVSGRVTGPDRSALQGARVELQPKGLTAVSDSQGQFTISDVPSGSYTLTVSYIGFAPFSTPVSVTAGGVAQVEALLRIEVVSEQVIVRGERERGEIEALNRERTADTIIQVLPAEVITSLPNTNVADALGRLPSVSLERDEGEGKYIQIRGTEPRLNNVTINGVRITSPESDVRTIKLDVIPAVLVESIELSKTLSANQDGDAIGGSVNLVTRTADDEPFYSVSGIYGYTPIINGRQLSQFDGTVAKRFGREKRLGVALTGSYDYNPRGFNNIEPAPGTNDFLDGRGPVPIFSGIHLREYQYRRHRYGFAGSADYRLLGGIIGLEREIRRKSAGLRTNMFICIGSALFTMLSDELAGKYGIGDHTRIAAQIISGIGFLGAGAIIRERGTVVGLTTAATIFSVASIGMAVGGGLYVTSVFACLLILVLLVVVGWLENLFSLKTRRMVFRITSQILEATISSTNAAFAEADISVQHFQVLHVGTDFLLEFEADVSVHQQKKLTEKISPLGTKFEIVARENVAA